MSRFAFEGGGADGGGHFYVCERTGELNEHFGDLLHKIQDLEVMTLGFTICQWQPSCGCELQLLTINSA